MIAFDGVVLLLEVLNVSDELLMLTFVCLQAVYLRPVPFNHGVLVDYVTLHLVKLILVRFDEFFHD